MWLEHLVDGTAVKFVDPREMPSAWETGWLPLHRPEPYGLPPPRPAERKEMVWHLGGLPRRGLDS